MEFIKRHKIDIFCLFREEESNHFHRIPVNKEAELFIILMAYMRKIYYIWVID